MNQPSVPACDDDKILLQQAKSYRDADRYDDAIRVASQYVALQPDDPQGMASLVRSLNGAGRSAEALPLARQSVAAMPQDALAWSDLATALGKTGAADEALNAIRYAVQLAPENWGMRVMYTIHLLDAARAVLPRSYISQTLIFRLLSQTWHDATTLRRQALEQANAACQMAPDVPLPHLARGDALRSLHQRNMANEEYKFALKLDPDNVDARRILAADAAQSSRTNAAVSGFASILSTNPDDQAARRSIDTLLGRLLGVGTLFALFTAMDFTFMTTGQVTFNSIRIPLLGLAVLIVPIFGPAVRSVLGCDHLLLRWWDAATASIVLSLCLEFFVGMPRPVAWTLVAVRTLLVLAAAVHSFMWLHRRQWHIN